MNPMRMIRWRLRPFATHDLAAQQQPKLVLQNVHDVGRQTSKWFATEVGNVYCNASAGLKCSHTLGEHSAEQLEVLDVRARDALFVELFFVGLASKVGWRRNHESN
jgi:hypothetical protein